MNDWEVRVISETQQLRDRIKWLENGLKEIMKISKNMNISSDESRIVHIVQSTLDGEPTTADEYNESQEIEGIELKHESENTMQEDEKLVFEEQFGGDTGVDADYFSNNDKQHDKNAEIAEYDRKYWEEEE
jgi:hypothetical protein